ncbi:MAG TPA: ABC transporter ATP-binding protein [Micromonosporaceae bacterium]
MTSLLALSNVNLAVPSAGRMLPILDEITLEVAAGESLGLVGESGSGKSMTTRTIARLLPAGSAVGGSITFDGTDVGALTGRALRDYRVHDVGMIFQDARAHLDPLQRIGDFMIEPAAIRGTASRRQALADAEELLRDVGIDDPGRRLRQYPLELSGGMLQRVMIASVLLARPRLVLADEPTTALDVTTQSDVLAILDQLRRDAGTALIFVTHDLDLAAAVCDRIAVMYAGSVQEVRPAAALTEAPLHPYSEALLASRPDIRATAERLPVVPGRPVSAFEAPHGCVFAPRCPHSADVCTSTRPAFEPITDGAVRCVRVHELHPKAAR